MGGCVCKDEIVTGKILFLGLPDSGKTTLLYHMKLKEVVTSIPTHGYNMEYIDIGTQSLEVWDVGGRVEDRNDYLFCMKDVAAVVFLIDASAPEKRYTVALRKLQLTLSEVYLSRCPVAVVANKQDLETEIAIDKIQSDLETKDFMKNRYWKVIPISSTTGDGIPALVKWLDKHFGKEKKIKEDNKKKIKKKRRRSKITHSSFNFHANRRDEAYHIATHSVCSGDDI